MIKKYLEFINETLKEDFFNNKKSIKSLNSIIEKKLNIFSIQTYYKDRFFYNDYDYINGENINKNNHTIFLDFSLKKEDILKEEEIIKDLGFDFNINVTLKKFKHTNHINQFYILSYNLNEMLESNIGKSLQNINKFNL